MKSLYNIAGILPAQCRANPNDCGIAWSEHRSKHPAGRGKAGIELHIALDSQAIRDDLKKLDAYLNPAESAAPSTLKPIDPATIKVGDTVRLVGSRTITEWPHCNLKVGNNYKVIEVDRNCDEGMSISVSYNSHGIGGQYFWIYDEDLMLVESA